MPAHIVYGLCAVTSFACAFLLLRGYRRTRARLLLWAALCFAGLAIDNGFLFIDRVMVPDQTVFAARRLFSLLGVSLLLFGLIWEADR
jgi:hypothetical protein